MKSTFLSTFLMLMIAGFLIAEDTPQDSPKLTVTKRGKKIAEFKGSGNETTKSFDLKKAPATFNAVLKWEKRDVALAPGEGDFSVVLLDSKGKFVDRIIGTLGHFDGARTIEIATAGTYQLKITAPGKWEISVEQ